MYNITPIEYLSGLAKEIVLTNNIIQPDNRYWIEISNINGLTFDIFEGRIFKIYKADNNQISGAVTVEYQKRIIAGIEKSYLIFPNTTYSTYRNVTVKAYGTFQVSKDNQAITLMDVYSVKNVLGQIDVNGDVLNAGKPGIVSGIETAKLKSLKGFYLLNSNLHISNNNTELCRIKLSQGNINQIRIACLNQTYSLNLDLRIKYVDDTTFINTLRTESTGDDILVKFSVSIQKYLNVGVTEYWAVLVWKSPDIIKTDVKLFVEIPDILNTKPSGTSQGAMVNLTWNNNGDLTNGIGVGSVIEVPITQELSYIDNNTIKYDIYVGETNHRHLAIKANQNLQTLIPGKCYYTPEAADVTKLTNIPIGLTDSFTVQCIKTGLTDIRATYILITKRGKLFYGYLENNMIRWVTPSLSDHIHQAKEIITDATHRFVTDLWINKVNQGLAGAEDIQKNTLWKPTGYANKADLPNNPTPGTNVVVLSDETNNNQTINYLYDGNAWIPSSINALKIVSLTNNSGLMSSDMLSRLNAAEKQFMMGVGTNWQRLENVQSNHLDNKNRVIDFVYRGADTTNYDVLGDDSIAFGNGNISVPGSKSFVVGFDTAKISGEYQVSLGQDLRYSGTMKNVTLFGKYNQDDNDIVFAYGIGESDAERKNAFWVSKTGDDYFFNTNFGYRIANKGDNDILLASGGTFEKSSIPTEDSIMSRVMAFLNATMANQTTDIIKFEDYSGNTYNTLPIIQQRWKNPIKYMAETWAEFKEKVSLLKTPLLSQKIMFVGYPGISEITEYSFIEGGVFNESGDFTKENENWCILNIPDSGPILPPVGNAKSIEGNLFMLTTDNKIYRFNAGKLNTTGANTWMYFGIDINMA